MDHRTEQMERVATQMETIVKENGRRDDIAITYCEMDAESLADFTDWQCQKNKLFIGLDEGGAPTKDYTKAATPAGKAGVDYHMVALRCEIDF